MKSDTVDPASGLYDATLTAHVRVTVSLELQLEHEGMMKSRFLTQRKTNVAADQHDILKQSRASKQMLSDW